LSVKEIVPVSGATPEALVPNAGWAIAAAARTINAASRRLEYMRTSEVR
jgi:hypothetical protein